MSYIDFTFAHVKTPPAGAQGMPATHGFTIGFERDSRIGHSETFDNYGAGAFGMGGGHVAPLVVDPQSADAFRGALLTGNRLESLSISQAVDDAAGATVTWRLAHAGSEQSAPLASVPTNVANVITAATAFEQANHIAGA